MSTYIHLECRDHQRVSDGSVQPAQSEDESGQHLYDLPQLRFDWANRDHWLGYIDRFPDTLTHEFDHLSYFQRHTYRFIREHRHCDPLRMHVVDEYGREYHLEFGTQADLFSTAPIEGDDQ